MYCPTCPGSLPFSNPCIYHMETSLQKSREREFFLTKAIVKGEGNIPFQEQWWQQNQWWHELASTTSRAVWGIESLFSRESSNGLAGMMCHGSSCSHSLCSCTFSQGGSIQPSTNAVSHSISFQLKSARVSFHHSQLKRLRDTLRS